MECPFCGEDDCECDDYSDLGDDRYKTYRWTDFASAGRVNGGDSPFAPTLQFGGLKSTDSRLRVAHEPLAVSGWSELCCASAQPQPGDANLSKCDQRRSRLGAEYKGAPRAAPSLGFSPSWCPSQSEAPKLVAHFLGFVDTRGAFSDALRLPSGVSSRMGRASGCAQSI